MRAIQVTINSETMEKEPVTSPEIQKPLAAVTRTGSSSPQPPALSQTTIEDVLQESSAAQRLFYHLSDQDLASCYLVNRTWYEALREYKPMRRLQIPTDLARQFEGPKTVQNRGREEQLQKYLDRYRNASQLVVRGWTKDYHTPAKFYDTLLTDKVRAKVLILKGRGNWNSCRCPAENGSRAKLAGKQLDTAKARDLTNLELIHVGSTFTISACALLDLVSRSPNLKTLRFHGRLTLHQEDHTEPFACKTFHSDLSCLSWPWPEKSHHATIATLVKRNENIESFHSSSEVTCDLLSTDLLTSVRFLSLNLIENWGCKPGHHKKIFKYVQRLKYLSLAKSVEALEVRTFPANEENSCKETATQIERAYENYQLTFWQQVAGMHKLKFLAIYGSWEFEKVCHDMAKNALQIEYLKINLMPTSVITALDALDDAPVLSMAEGVRNLRKLAQLRSMHFICYEKLYTIDRQTVTALKELMDVVWIFDIKTGFTEEVEDLLNNFIRRGNQLGKTYSISLHILSKDDYCNLLVKHPLKLSTGVSLRAKLQALAEAETSDRYGKSCVDSFHIWNLEQVSNSRDKKMFDMLTANWKLYNDKFYVSHLFI